VSATDATALVDTPGKSDAMPQPATAPANSAAATSTRLRQLRLSFVIVPPGCTSETRARLPCSRLIFEKRSSGLVWLFCGVFLCLQCALGLSVRDTYSAHQAFDSARRRALRPRKSRDFTVPMEICSKAAISSYEKPSSSKRTTTRRN